MEKFEQEGGWYEVVLETQSGNSDAVAGLLADAGFPGVEIREGAGGACRIALHFTAADDAQARSRADALAGDLPEGLLSGPGLVDVVALDESVWTENWKDFFPATEIGPTFTIVPPWIGADQVAESRRPIVINPGLAFGTGQHETTALCLELIQENFSSGMRALDLGCGSAILAIACAMLGAKEVTAIDNDPEALNAARENLVANGVEDVVSLELGERAPECGSAGIEPYDLVVSNIYAEVLAGMSEAITGCVKPEGCLVLSGIEKSRRSLVEDAFGARGWGLQGDPGAARERGEWVALLFRRES